MAVDIDVHVRSPGRRPVTPDRRRTPLSPTIPTISDGTAGVIPITMGEMGGTMIGTVCARAGAVTEHAVRDEARNETDGQPSGRVIGHGDHPFPL